MKACVWKDRRGGGTEGNILNSFLNRSVMGKISMTNSFDSFQSRWSHTTSLRHDRLTPVQTRRSSNEVQVTRINERQISIRIRSFCLSTISVTVLIRIEVFRHTQQTQSETPSSSAAPNKCHLYSHPPVYMIL